MHLHVGTLRTAAVEALSSIKGSHDRCARSRPPWHHRHHRSHHGHHGHHTVATATTATTAHGHHGHTAATAATSAATSALTPHPGARHSGELLAAMAQHAEVQDPEVRGLCADLQVSANHHSRHSPAPRPRADGVSRRVNIGWRRR
jgi:hypothetical protein